ncbi:MAG: rRNA maturation RNase YbeY [Proteobacteria bacterium]|nr:rRNA maturation RNase YbeY [Pseudomonadota bacterium]
MSVPRHDGAHAIAVQYAVARRGLPAAATVRRYADAALAVPAAVTVRFVGRREGRALNAQFRGRDYATNVLTFVYDDVTHQPGRGHTRMLTGDIVLCVPVLVAEAKAQRKTLRAHCAHLIVHGLLHLQGHDHERPGEAARMERREVALLAAFGIANPYATPVASA